MFMWGMLIQGKTSFWLRLTEDETELLKESSVGVEKVFRRVWGFEVEDSSTAAFAKALTADGYDKVAVTALTEFFVNGVVRRVAGTPSVSGVLPSSVPQELPTDEKKEEPQKSDTLLIVLLVTGGVLLVGVGVFFALFCLCRTGGTISGDVVGNVEDEAETLIAGGGGYCSGDAAHQSQAGISGGQAPILGDVAAVV